ncbi:SRPBCC family protein [Nodosilinea sp. E11]|uniref:SRPBCC family protein n=1 Tax=Nodosilinea sp. E11 TaxID=3037479 RepID=UPI0029348D9C|nr:SRPBCC family protein [Nodosilinea sp. E11]WOD38801.1 SRPBCC family protein [Nodosilinea sp. E11]
MSTRQVFNHGISICASATAIEQCLTRQDLMHRWLNPALCCEPIGDWSTDLGAKSRFIVRLPLWQPTLISTVVERGPDSIVWAFSGFFTGQDRWEWRPDGGETQLFNQFEFEIPNPLVQAGFNWFAAGWTQRDMAAQLNRLKQVAETLDH